MDRTAITPEDRAEAAYMIGDNVEDPDPTKRYWQAKQTADGHTMVVLTPEAIALAEGPAESSPFIRAITSTRGHVQKVVMNERREYWHPRGVRVGEILISPEDFAEMRGDVNRTMSKQQ